MILKTIVEYKRNMKELCLGLGIIKQPRTGLFCTDIIRKVNQWWDASVQITVSGTVFLSGFIIKLLAGRLVWCYIVAG